MTRPAETGETLDRSYRALLRQPSLAKVVLSMQLGRVGTYMLPIVFVLYALDAYDSAPLAGLLTLLSLLPGLVGAPVIGALLDRYGRLRLIAVDYVVETIGVLIVGVVAVNGRVPEALLISVAFVLGVTQMFSDSGLRSLFPRLAPPHLWERVNAIDSLGYQTGMILGPPLAATIFAIAGAAPAFVVIAAVYGAAALSLVGAREPAGPPPEEHRILHSALAGLRYVWSNHTLRGLAASVSMTMVSVGLFSILVPVILVDALQEPGTLVGIAFSIAGILGIVAALALGRANTNGREKQLVLAAEIGTTISAALLLPAPTSVAVAGVTWVIGAAALYGFSGGVWDIAVFTVRQRRTDPRLLGRAIAISMALNSSGYPIGAALGGFLVTQSIELAIYVTIGFGLLGTVLGLLLIPASDGRAESVAASAASS
jgi:MFS family permease